MQGLPGQDTRSQLLHDDGLLRHERHAVTSEAKGASAAIADMSGGGKLVKLAAHPSANLIGLLAGNGAFDPGDHAALRGGEVHVAADARKRDVVLVGQLDELLQLLGATVQTVQVPHDDRASQPFPQVTEHASVGGPWLAVRRRDVVVGVYRRDGPAAPQRQLPAVLLLTADPKRGSIVRADPGVDDRLQTNLPSNGSLDNITLLNVLTAAIPVRERVVTIEDVAELRLPGPHVVRLEGRPPNVEGRGEVPLRELVRNALRMRPDRIVVGEVRGPEVLDMLQAANTGHRGLMTTLHAGGPEEVPARLEAMALTAPGAGLDVVRRLVGGGIGAVVHLERAPTSRPMRRVAVVAELVTSSDGRARAIPLRTAGGTNGLTATGHVPHWANRLDPSVLPAFEPTHPAGRVRVLCPRSRTR